MSESTPRRHPVSGQSVAEEIVNSITHGLGVVFGVVATVFLVIFAAGRGDAGLVVGCAVFGASVILLYLASTLYHGIQSARWKARLQRLDHVAIYLLIAGTYTPFALGPMRGAFGITLLCVVWALALAGGLRKLLGGPGRDLVSVALYLGMGWMAVIAFPMLHERLPGAALGWLIGGGTAYTLGTAFFLWQKLPFGHSVWHVFVLGGTVSHAVAILFFVHPALAGAA